MDVQGKGKNVNLRISDISRSMVSTIPDLLLDILEVAAYVYCADQRANRGSEILAQAGSEWCRAMRFVIPVRRYDVWSSPLIGELLASSLSFLSDDHFEFEFVPAVAAVPAGPAYFPELSEGFDEPDKIALFSGGVDSFAGAVETIGGGSTKTLLVGHYSASKVFAIQWELVRHLKQAGRVLFVPVNVTNANVDPIEATQRTRSFLFASLAFVLTRMFGKDNFTFFENGVLSFNLPIARDVLGARATRTTHPRVIRRFEALFSALAETTVTIHTPYLWLTKAEVAQRIVHGGFGHLLWRTVSCAHPREWTQAISHCGVCSQCIDRRFAVLAAGAGELEPARGYDVDLLTGRRNHEEIPMATAYLKFCRTVARVSREEFVREYPSVASSLADIPGLSTREVLDRIWRLHRRHAEGVIGVLEAGLERHRRDLIYGTLPGSSLLALSLVRSRIEHPPTLDYHQQMIDFVDRMPAPVCEFAVDEHSRRICFRGGFALEGAHYRLISALLGNHRSAKQQGTSVLFISRSELAQTLNIDEQSLRQQIARARTKLAERLTVDQGIVLPNGFIETGARLEGYRVSPETREVSLADICAVEAG